MAEEEIRDDGGRAPADRGALRVARPEDQLPITRVRIVPDRTQYFASLGSLVTGLATVGLLIGVALQIDTTNRQLRAGKMEQRFSQFSSPRLLYARARAADEFPVLGQYTFEVFTFFERLASDYQQGVVGLEDVWFDFKDPLYLYWCGWREGVKKARTDAGENAETGVTWRAFQDLVADMQRTYHDDCISTPQIDYQLSFEARRFLGELAFSETMSHAAEILEQVALDDSSSVVVADPSPTDAAPSRDSVDN